MTVPSKPITIDTLKAAPPEELLEAFIHEAQLQGLSFNNMSPYDLVRLGFRLRGPDGWQEIAPRWLYRYRTRHDALSEESR